MKINRFYHFVFIVSLIFCLWFNNTPITATPVSAAFLKQGIELYNAGDFPGAIEIWLKSISEGEDSKTKSEIQVRQYLALAYQQIGEIDKTINYLNQVIDYYRTTSNMQQVGRMLTEVAQAYSELGQHQRAINLLCGNPQKQQVCSENSALGIANRQKDNLGTSCGEWKFGKCFIFLR